MFSGSFSMDLSDFCLTHLKPSPSRHLCTRAWSHNHPGPETSLQVLNVWIVDRQSRGLGPGGRQSLGGLPQAGLEDIPMVRGNRCLMGFPDFSLVPNGVLPYSQEGSARLAWAMLQTLRDPLLTLSRPLIF